MKRVTLFTALIVSIAFPSHAQQPRIASDFEIAQMEKQLERARGFEARLAGHLNLGDLHTARNERSSALGEYQTALALALEERLASRRASSLSRYATATSYAALAAAKLGRRTDAYLWLDESLRYASDEAGNWNLYASAMRILGEPNKAIAAARNAVTIARGSNDPLDLAVYRYALATALAEAGALEEAEQVLSEIATTLRSQDFASLQRDVARQEAFEVYSSARGDVAAYVSLLNRTQLRLASLYERRAALDLARAEYRRVLDARSDDVTALGALARLAATDAERERLYAEAFEANPLSLDLVRAYQQHLRDDRGAGATAKAGDSAGVTMRAALTLMKRGQLRAARERLDALATRFPESETLQMLRRETDGPVSVEVPVTESPSVAQLRALRQGFETLTPQQRVALDRTTYVSVVTFDEAAKTADGRMAFASGSIDGVAFRFAEPTVFAGAFDDTTPLRLTYRILGVSRAGDADVLLFEPIRLEATE